MAEFVVFVILTCGQITDSVLFSNKTGMYWQGSIPQIQSKLNEGNPKAKVSVISVKNNVGVCS